MKKHWKTYLFYSLTVLILMMCAEFFSSAATAFAEWQDEQRKFCVVIDPGHGGEDGGAVSCTGIPESRYNLEISQRLNDLMRLLGYQTKMIRQEDISVYTKGETLAQKKVSDLKERVRMVNETDGGLLLSIHQNYFSDSRYSGAQVFYAETEGSEQLAKQLQSAMVSALNRESRRQAKRSSGIYLMEKIQCTGILVECGFLSNAAEEALLRDPEYQKKLGAVIAVTVSQYLSNT